MPICKNDSKRNYKGNEPSPKGLGFCAHAEPVHKKRKGLDGNMWIVKEVSNGKRWFKTKTKTKTKSKSKSKYKNILYDKPLESIQVEDNNVIKKIPLKNYSSYFSMKDLQKGLDDSDLDVLLSYIDDNNDKLQTIKLKSSVYEKNLKPYVRIYIEDPTLQVDIKDIKKIKKYLSEQIRDGWNETGLQIKKWSIFLK